MRARNPNYDRAAAVTNGHIGARRSGTPGHTSSDTSGNSVTAPETQFIGATVSGEDGETAYVTVTGSGQNATNNSGGTLAYGDVVVLDTDGSVILTTTAQDTRPVGVVQVGGGDGDSVAVVFSGYVAQVNTTGTVLEGEYLETSTTGGDAESNASRRTGSFGIALADGPNPPALLFGIPDTTGSGGGGGGVPGWFNVRDYGAVGDDTTDDTAAIQAAIDACIAAGGGTVYVPTSGFKYKITSALAVGTVTLHILGDGAGDTYHDGMSCIRQATANTSGIVFTYPAYPCMVQGLRIEGPTGNSSGNGVSISAGDLILQDVVIEGFYDSAVWSATTFYSKAYHSRFTTADNAGALLTAGGNNMHFYGCRFDNCAIGLDVGGHLSVGVFGGTVELNSTAGIRANGGSSNGAGLLISGAYLEQNDGIPDILLGNSSVIYAVTIEGNAFVKSGYTGSGWHIDGQNVNGLTVIGNEFMSSDAVRAVGSSTGVVLMNNRNRNAGTLTLPAGSINVDTTSTAASAVGTAAAGTSTKVARVDHVHATGAGTPSTQAIGDAASTGTGPAAAMTDHKHAMPAFGSPVAVSSANADGAATTVARSDHVHQGATAATGGHEHIVDEQFNGDATTTVFPLSNEAAADSVMAWVSGVRTPVTLSATFDAITFGSAPASGTNNISVDYAATLE